MEPISSGRFAYAALRDEQDAIIGYFAGVGTDETAPLTHASRSEEPEKLDQRLRDQPVLHPFSSGQHP